MMAISALLALWPTATAHAWRLPDHPGGWKRFSLGVTSGIVGHELGHVAVATMQGNRVAFDGLSLVYPNARLGGAEQFQVASAGFQAQWLLSEAVLWPHEQRPDRPVGDFGAGVVVAHLAITGAYLTVLNSHHLGDLQGMSSGSGMSRGRLLALVSIPAVLDGWRLFGAPPRWLPSATRLIKGGGIAAVWDY